MPEHAKIGHRDADIADSRVFGIVIRARFGEPLRRLAEEQLAAEDNQYWNSERSGRHGRDRQKGTLQGHNTNLTVNSVRINFVTLRFC